MRYRLFVTLNYKHHDREYVHPELTEDELISHIQAYLHKPSTTSLVFTIAKGRGISDISLSI